MKKIALNSVIALMLFFLLIPGKTITACNADFNYSNACAGDTVWFSPVWGGPCTWDFGDTLSSVNCSHFINPYHVYTCNAPQNLDWNQS